jgi:hypothetical protein
MTDFVAPLPPRQTRPDLLPLFIADFDIVLLGYRKPPFDDRPGRSLIQGATLIQCNF